MTIDQALSYINKHNTAIIEGLVAVIILLGLFLGYRSFFGKKGESSGLDHGGGLDTAQLEKTLQKILDNQGSAKPAAHHEDMGVDAPVSADKAAPAVGESPQEVQQLRLTLSESQKKIEVLQAELKIAEIKATENEAAAAAAAAGGAAGGPSPELEAKLKDLEARLAEYEIISEDIADLSRFREENEKLKSEIDALKAAGSAPAPAAPAAPAAEPEPTPAPVAADPDIDAIVKELAVQDTSTPEPAPAPAESVIDDDLMREFAAAVEGQKALDKVGEKAGDGSETADTKTDENAKLMDEFENFVTKKS